jgi:phosphoglycolate phosphatase
MKSMWTKPPDLKGVLFDKDGTLVDFSRTWTGIIKRSARIASAGNVTLERELLVACGTDPATGTTAPDSLFASGNTLEIAERMRQLGSPLTVPDLVRQMDELFVRGSSDAVAITDLVDVFEKIKSLGLLIGIASSDNEASIRITLQSLGIAGTVDFVAGYDSGHGVKPEPGMVRAFCAHAGCTPSQVLLVGDNRHDLEMGRAAGCGGNIGVLSGTGTAATLETLADVLLSDVGKLPDLLFDNGRSRSVPNGEIHDETGH